MKVWILFLAVCLTSCVSNEKEKNNQSFKITEKEISLPIKNNFLFFDYFKHQSNEYFSYLDKDTIRIISLQDYKVKDSIIITLPASEIEKYGNLSSYCFNGTDSLYILYDNALLFLHQKKLNKIIPINSQDSINFNGLRFANLEDVAIYYDPERNEIIGQVYCSVCPQKESSFYQQKVIGRINMATTKFSTLNITYPYIYKNGYFGFANKVYSNSYDQFTFLSFPSSEYVYTYNRKLNTTDSFFAKSKFQNSEMPLLDTQLADSREEKMKHLVRTPYYSEILYDTKRSIYYRFFLQDIPLKNADGRYNSFRDKNLILTVFDSTFKNIGELKLPNLYSSYISFVGDSGLYIRNFEKSHLNTKDAKSFKIITISK